VSIRRVTKGSLDFGAYEVAYYLDLMVIVGIACMVAGVYLSPPQALAIVGVAFIMAAVGIYRRRKKA